MSLYLGVLHARVFPRLREVTVVPEDRSMVKSKLALFGVLVSRGHMRYDSLCVREENPKIFIRVFDSV